MKSIVYKLIIGAVLISAVSCQKFLEENPEGNLKTEDFYKTEGDANYAVSAVYYLLNAGGNVTQTPYNTLFNTGLNFMADDEFPGATQPDVRSMANNLHTSTNLRVYELWQQHYAAVYKANLAITKIPTIVFTAATAGVQTRLIGEAKFLRALWYFNLVRLFGDVPLILEPVDYVKATDYAIERTASALVYAQIEKDLTEAAAVLPPSYASPNVGRATKGAALSLLAKVYLTKASLPLNLTEHYADAVATAELAISPSEGGTGVYGYALQANYANVFLPAFKNNSEHIFSAQFKNSGGGATYLTQGNNQNPRSIRANVPGLAGSYADQVWFYNKPDATKPDGVDHFFSVFKLYKSKDVEVLNTVTGVTSIVNKAVDKRRDVTFVTNFRSSTTQLYYGTLNNTNIKGNKLDSVPYFNKTWDPSATANTNESGANVAIIRYAELLLIHAEAENELNGPTTKAYNSLNFVRTRAGLPNLTAGLSQAQFRDSLYLDRRLELVFEYQRWFDLVRQKDASGNSIFVSSLHAVGKTNATERNRLHPIPQNEIQLNAKLTQNPGY